MVVSFFIGRREEKRIPLYFSCSWWYSSSFEEEIQLLSLVRFYSQQSLYIQIVQVYAQNHCAYTENAVRCACRMSMSLVAELYRSSRGKSRGRKSAETVSGLGMELISESKVWD